MANLKKVFVAGPYVGELGWEIFSWQPLVRNQFLMGEFDKCIVYTGPGKDKLYPWAEVRVPPNMPQHESECLCWRNLPEHVDELNNLIKTTVASVEQEFKGKAQIHPFTIAMIQPWNQAHYEKGRPDLLRTKQEPSKSIDDVKTIVLCVRDRELSDFRNWEYENWYSLAKKLKQKFNVTVLGQIRKPDEWKMPDGVKDLTNQTTINDCIDIFSSECDLAVGGSTGLLHLASRCAAPHLVWGAEKNIIRYAESNWFGAAHKVYVWGWEPSIDQVYIAVNEFMNTLKV